MAEKILVESAIGDVTTAGLAITSSQAEIIVTGTFTSVTFEDNKFGHGWADVLDANTGEPLVLTEATNELQLISATNTGRSLRAVIVGGADVSIYVDEGIS